MSATIGIRLDGRLGRFRLDVDIAAPMRGITALFGPSGCGKTSILRAVAGLSRLPGRIAVGPEVWQDDRSFLAPHRREVGYVFQEASLFPHLSVRGNLDYGRARAKGAGGGVDFDGIVTLLGIGQLLDRAPANLSGGERQRVSIGRALLSRPRLLLMDEPLAALDRMAKDEILPYLEALHAGLEIPILYVTHDLAEVERLADHLVLLREGRVVASGPLDEMLTAEGAPTAARRDAAAVLSARVAAIEADGLARLDLFGHDLLLVDQSLAVGQRVRVRIAAGDVSVALAAATGTSILNALPCRVVGIEPKGPAEVLLRLSLAGSARPDILARISRRSGERLGLGIGMEVVAQIKGVSLVASR